MRVAAGRVSAPLVVVLLAAASMAAPGAASAAFDPAPGARAAVLVEQSTGQRLFARAADQSLPVASATKLMTALVTLEHVHRLATVFTQNLFYPAAVDSQIGLVPGERMSVHDLLLALMLPSADDAAEDLADNVGHGSVGGFVAMMNARARQLGLTHTHYSTPIGLDTAGNFSSAGDLAPTAPSSRGSWRCRVRSCTPGTRSGWCSTATAWWRAFPGSTASRPATPSAPGTSWSHPPRAGA